MGTDADDSPLVAQAIRIVMRERACDEATAREQLEGRANGNGLSLAEVAAAVVSVEGGTAPTG